MILPSISAAAAQLLTFCIDLFLHGAAHLSLLISAHLYQINLVTSPLLSLYFCVIPVSPPCLCVISMLCWFAVVPALWNTDMWGVTVADSVSSADWMGIVWQLWDVFIRVALNGADKRCQWYTGQCQGIVSDLHTNVRNWFEHCAPIRCSH